MVYSHMDHLYANHVKNMTTKIMLLSRGKHMKIGNIFTKIPCSIVEFEMVNYQPMLNKYAYHRMLIYLLGKN